MIIVIEKRNAKPRTIQVQGQDQVQLSYDVTSIMARVIQQISNPVTSFLSERAPANYLSLFTHAFQRPSADHAEGWSTNDKTIFFCLKIFIYLLLNVLNRSKLVRRVLYYHVCNSRLKSYKNKGLDADELRRRREEEGVQLRKAKREEQVLNNSACEAYTISNLNKH